MPFAPENVPRTKPVNGPLSAPMNTSHWGQEALGRWVKEAASRPWIKGTRKGDEIWIHMQGS